MGASVKLGRIRGIEVGVHWSVLVVLALITVSLATVRLPDDVEGYSDAEYWSAAFVTSALFLVSIFAHELSHALVAQQRRVPVKRITLWLLGGIAELKGGAKTPRDEFQIAIVGPLMSLAVGLAVGVTAVVLDIADAPQLLVAMLAWLAGVNGVLAVFNLVPAAPLDGGRVLRALLWRWKKDPVRATVIAAAAGRVFGLALVALGVLLVLAGSGGLWYLLLGWFVINAATSEEHYAMAEDRLSALHVRDIMSTQPVTAPPDIDIERFVNDYVMRRRFSSFPVVDASGRVHGLLTLRRVKDLPRERWRATRVIDVACPLDEVPTAAPDESLVSLHERMDADCAEGRAVVLEDGRLVGIVSPSDIGRVLEVAELVGADQHATSSAAPLAAGTSSNLAPR